MWFSNLRKNCEWMKLSFFLVQCQKFYLHGLKIWTLYHQVRSAYMILNIEEKLWMEEIVLFDSVISVPKFYLHGLKIWTLHQQVRSAYMIPKIEEKLWMEEIVLFGSVPKFLPSWVVDSKHIFVWIFDSTMRYRWWIRCNDMLMLICWK